MADINAFENYLSNLSYGSRIPAGAVSVTDLTEAFNKLLKGEKTHIVDAGDAYRVMVHVIRAQADAPPPPG